MSDQKLQRRFQSADLFIISVIFLNLLVAVFIVADYGENWDEFFHIQFGKDTLYTYKTLFLLDPEIRIDPFAPTYKGPLVNLTAAIIHSMITKSGLVIPELVSRHYLYYVIFQVGGLGFYWIARRLLEKWAAVGSTLLFLMQPLFWGHAFVNPKDTPFMALFILSMAAGIRMVDRLAEEFNKFEHEKEILEPANKSTRFPKRISSTIKNLMIYLRNPAVLLAGISLGLSMAVRNIGAYSGFLVATLAVIKFDRKAFKPLFAYIGIGGVVTYILWPYLWPAPILNFLTSLKVMSNFPWFGTVRFEGVFRYATELPWYYVPKIFAIQLTEPLLLLFFLGVVIFFWKREQHRENITIWGIILTWFVFFLIYTMMFKPALYDNARQVLFILPPVFLVAGLGLSWLNAQLKKNWIKTSLLVVVLLPGIISIVQNHPFQYVYYNQLVGGTQKAFRHYEMEYLFTGLNQVMDHLNQELPEGAYLLMVERPVHIVKKYARNDLVVFGSDEIPPDQFADFDYAIMGSRWNADLRYFPEAPVIYTVSLGEIDLIVVKKIN